MIRMAPESVYSSVLIDGQPEAVYQYFVEADAMVRWMGHRASLDPRPGGEFTVEIEGATVQGRYLELDPPRRLLISWGFAGSSVLPPGTSRVEVRLTPEGAGTRVELVHDGLLGDLVLEHTNGWRHFLKSLADSVEYHTAPQSMTTLHG